MIINMGVSTNGGTPIAGWFIWWKIPSGNGWFGGTPISGNHHLSSSNHIKPVWWYTASTDFLLPSDVLKAYESPLDIIKSHSSNTSKLTWHPRIKLTNCIVYKPYETLWKTLLNFHKKSWYLDQSHFQLVVSYGSIPCCIPIVFLPLSYPSPFPNVK